MKQSQAFNNKEHTDDGIENPKHFHFSIKYIEADQFQTRYRSNVTRSVLHDTFTSPTCADVNVIISPRKLDHAVDDVIVQTLPGGLTFIVKQLSMNFTLS